LGAAPETPPIAATQKQQHWRIPKFARQSLLTTGDKARLFRRVTHIFTQGSNLMLKKVFLASAVSLLLAGITLTAAPGESLASKSHCWKAAKDKYGMKLLKRHSYRKACKKAWKAANK
jgi:hypothetical protein